MTCKTLQGDGYIAIVCTRGKRPIVCKCGARGDKLCDYPIGEGKTCDKPLCDTHAVPISRGVDYCPTHAKMAQEKA